MNTRSKLRARCLAGALVVGAVAIAQCGLAHAQSATQILTAGCADDARRFCSGVAPGGGRIVACLKQNRDSLSEQCKQAAARASSMPAGGAPGAAPATAPAGSAASSDEWDAIIRGPAATPQAAAGTSGSPARPSRPSTAPVSGRPAVAEAGGSYLVMKRVQVTGPGQDAAHPTMPAYDLMIPSTWKIEGGVRFGGGPGGCFADLYAIALRATSADEATVFAAGPDDSWQYADDPSVLQSLNDPALRAHGVGGKPCPVARPMRAEDYIRQNILKLYPAGTTVVSVAPFPQLNEIVRRRRGLPPGNGNTGATRTEAVRVRLAYQKDGRDVEAWVAVCVVVDIQPAGRGSFYDSHATSLVAFSAPKGQLDANDRLFQVIVASIQPEPQWVTYSSSVLSKLYQAQAQKVATINRIRSQFYAREAQMINEETAAGMRGSNASVFHEDQNIRGVQTFRDPATGRTQELSNLYDHAWRNGSDEYIMSNDPNFNPNEHLNGNWNELQAVNP
jgi:hypothetical protein